MAIIGSIAAAVGSALAGGAAGTGAAVGTSSALMSALTAATSAGAGTAASAGAGSALSSAITAATAAGGAGATSAAGAGAGSAVTSAITAATSSTGGATAATSAGAGIGKAVAMGAVKGSLLNAGITAAQGGSPSDILKAGAIGAGTGAGSGLLSGVASGAKGAAEAGKATVNGQVSSQIGNTTMKAPGPAKLDVPGITAGKTPGTIPGNTIKYDIPANAGKAGLGAKIQQAGSTVAQSRFGQGVKTAVNSKPGQAVLKGAGQYGVQGALSLLSMGQAAKQANAANAIQQQSLLFQKQTYNEQMAEKESYKAGMKQTASTAYESARLFGSNLQGSDANNTLLTSYSTSGNGAIGDYSILTYSSSRTRDIT